MSSAFLQAFLKEEYQKIPLAKEGSKRQYTRIKTKTWSYVLASSPVEQQINFLNKLKDFSSADIQVPEVKAQDRKKGLLLLEDLGDLSLEKKVLNSSSFPFKSYEQALDQIIKLQKIDQNNWKSFKKEDFFTELLWTEKYMVQGLFGLKIKETVRKNYLKEFEDLCINLTKFPYKPVHRDYHSRNLFIKNYEIYVIDFQDAALFPRFYDLVSLLYDIYVGDFLNKQVRKKLLNYFLSQQNLLLKQVEEELLMVSIQRLFKACGSFASFYTLRGQSSHLKYISPSLALLEKLLREISNYPYFLSLVETCNKREEREEKGVFK